MDSQRESPEFPSAGKLRGKTGLSGVYSHGLDRASHSESTAFAVASDNNSKEQAEAVEATARVCDRFSLQAAAREILPKSRTAFCLRRLIEGKSEVKVLQSQEHHGTFYGNLAVCSSLWTCPVCAAKIAQRRREDLVKLVLAHQAGRALSIHDRKPIFGGTVVMVTLTFPHTAQDSLKSIMAKFSAALKRFKSGRVSQELRDYYDLVGTVRALEVTYGEQNGWHAHAHELWFLDGVGHDLEALKRAIYQHWLMSCRFAGLDDPSWEHGVDVTVGERVATYIGKWGDEVDGTRKWGLEDEVTKAHIKQGKMGGLTPWDFLRLYRDGGGYAARAAELFREYAAAFKGFRQLRFSKGLKALYEIEEKTDEEIAANQEDSARLLGVLTLNQWRRVLRADGRGELLRRARLGGWAAVLAYLASLAGATQDESWDAVLDYLEVKRL